MKTRYTYKYPREPWTNLREQVMKNKQCWWYSMDRAIEWIEEQQQPGYTCEPWVQLIEITDDAMVVIAECAEGGRCNTDPLVAMGLK